MGVVRLQCHLLRACVASAVLAIRITPYRLLRELRSRVFSDKGRVNTSKSGLLLFKQTCVWRSAGSALAQYILDMESASSAMMLRYGFRGCSSNSCTAA